MKKTLTVLFVLFIFGFAAASILLPDTLFSPMENRNLAQMPDVTWDGVVSGEFEQSFETAFADQFPLRNLWIGMKSVSEGILGKRENNGVYVCKDRLIEDIETPDAERIDQNIRLVNRFSESCEVPVYFTLIPTAALVYADELPQGAPVCDERTWIGNISENVNAEIIDTVSALENGETDLFYRTDHHWTSKGASLGAKAAAEAMGETLEAEYEPVTVTEEFYGTLYSKAGRWSVKPDTIEVYVPQDGITVTHIENGEETEGTLYDYDRLSEKDKYAFFMGGNQPLAVVKTGHEGKKLLLVRDSYADSEIPFLCEAFSEIHVADLRYFKTGLLTYIEENGIDEVLISYSIRNFMTDTNLAFMAR